MKSLILGFLLCPFLAISQLSITGSGSFTIDFDNTVSGVNNGQFAGSGFNITPVSGQLNSNAWRATGFSDGNGTFGGIHTSGDFARGSSSGGITTGGAYAFETSTGDYCLGIQPGGSDFTPGEFTLRLQNNSGSTINQLDIAYEIKVFNDETRSNSFNFSWSLDDALYTSVPTLDYASPEAADPAPAWVTEPKNTTLTSLNLADGAYLYLKWTGDDVSGSFSRDEFGLDDIVISGIVLPVELVSFSASVVDEVVRLNWTTASEMTNRAFEVEHSVDGRFFELMGTIPGSGTSDQFHDYTYIDSNPAPGINYYRLKQLDESGKINYSKIIEARVSQNGNPKFLYNASRNELKIIFPEASDESYRLNIFDAFGRQLNQFEIEPNTIEEVRQLSGCTPGVYFLQLQSAHNLILNYKIYLLN